MTGVRTTALCSAVAIPNGDGVPDWIELLPAGEIQTLDARGPYRVADAQAVIANSFNGRDKLVLDENHATDLAAPKGEPAPARGWIVELQERQGAIWGRVEWTGQGREMMADKQYNGISPAIVHRKDKSVVAILRASLTNNPNLIGMASLHQEGHDDMDLKGWLCELLGLASDASDDAIRAALAEKLKGGDDNVALQSALSSIATAAGLDANADASVVLAGVTTLAKGKADDTLVVALQSQVATLSTQLESVQTDAKKKAATAFVDAAIDALKPGVKPMRETYISMHMENPARVEELINAIPALQSSRAGNLPPKTGAADELGHADDQVIALMGIDPTDYKKTLAADATRKEAL